MTELFDASFSAINMPFTILFIIVLLYWALVILGVFSSESMDVDTDLDLDVDQDIEVSSANNGLSSILMFLNLGKIPFMIVLSILSLFMWIGAILGNHFFNESNSILIALIIFVPNLIVGIFCVKVFSYPLKKLFGALDEKDHVKKLDGMICTIKVAPYGKKPGQAIVDVPGTDIIINVKSLNEKKIERGAKAVIINKEKNKNYYNIDEFIA